MPIASACALHMPIASACALHMPIASACALHMPIQPLHVPIAYSLSISSLFTCVCFYIASSEGEFEDTVYDGTTDFTITIMDSMDVFTCDIGTFTIWDREASAALASVTFNTDYLFVS